VIFTLLTPAFHDDDSSPELPATVNDTGMQSSIVVRAKVENRFMADDF
jgi:hypothetical protein